jgi:hypothetical protein
MMYISFENTLSPKQNSTRKVTFNLKALQRPGRHKLADSSLGNIILYQTIPALWEVMTYALLNSCLNPVGEYFEVHSPPNTAVFTHCACLDQSTPFNVSEDFSIKISLFRHSKRTKKTSVRTDSTARIPLPVTKEVQLGLKC